ncbi:MAG: T9SS type A sorting domain-containing protein [Bacteroidetes bacterium]|nr:T9SS type A sorting domain-containing protein [Bacteroidota bacterium]
MTLEFYNSMLGKSDEQTSEEEAEGILDSRTKDIIFGRRRDRFDHFRFTLDFSQASFNSLDELVQNPLDDLGVINERLDVIGELVSVSNLIEKNSLKIYPNPFENNTIISFKLVSMDNIFIEVFDILGKKAGSLEKNNLKAGEYQYNFNNIVNTPVPGLYFLHITIGEQRTTKKIICNK